jgi:hypothetical protein
MTLSFLEYLLIIWTDLNTVLVSSFYPHIRGKASSAIMLQKKFKSAIIVPSHEFLILDIRELGKIHGPMF